MTSFLKLLTNLIYVFVFSLSSWSNVVLSAEINLHLTQNTHDHNIRISVKNNASTAIIIPQVNLTLAGMIYHSETITEIAAGESKYWDFVIELPELSGSYIQYAEVIYFNEGIRFSISNTVLFHFRETHILDDYVQFDPAIIHNEGSFKLHIDDSTHWKLLLPNEVEYQVTNEHQSLGVQIKGRYPGFANNYPIFAVQERIIDKHHYAQIYPSRLTLINKKPRYERGYLSDSLLIFAGFLSLLIVFFTTSEVNQTKNTRFITALSKTASRLLWLSAAYYFLRHGGTLFDWLSHTFDSFSWLTFFFNSFRDNFYSHNYEYFFLYFVDAYWLLCALLMLPYSYYLTSNYTLNKDKYTAPLIALLHPKNISFSKSNSSSLVSPVKLGLLIICVKLLFLPYLSSWIINNIIHQWSLTQNFTWSFISINAYIMASLILIDTSIFAFGYAFESHKIKSRLRSVDPTLLGWFVCLACYPPFNQYFFIPFDIALFPIHISAPQWIQNIGLVMITGCWGIFAWASIALGVKASNLTNRGIVNSGPYKYCRHPAYSVKMFAWTLQALFFGQYFIGLLIAFGLIYFLRAWTEERHLSYDPDYQNYKKQVPYLFIPKVI